LGIHQSWTAWSEPTQEEEEEEGEAIQLRPKKSLKKMPMLRPRMRPNMKIWVKKNMNSLINGSFVLFIIKMLTVV
jgi:hypothetical protein